MQHCTVILFPKHIQSHAPCKQCFNDRMISTNPQKSNTSSSQIKAPQKLLDTHFRVNPYKALIVLLRVCNSMFVAFVDAVQYV